MLCETLAKLYAFVCELMLLRFSKDLTQKTECRQWSDVALRYCFQFLSLVKGELSGTQHSATTHNQVIAVTTCRRCIGVTKCTNYYKICSMVYVATTLLTMAQSISRFDRLTTDNNEYGYTYVVASQHRRLARLLTCYRTTRVDQLCA
jgi:hypothetical protein